MLDFNNPETANRRSQAKELTLQEEDVAATLIRNRFGCLETQEEELLMRFLKYYNTLATYLAYTRGLWVTEYPELVSDPENKLYRLSNEPLEYRKQQQIVILLDDLNKTETFEYEEHLLVPVLNKMMSLYPVSAEEEKLLQRYLDHFQNMQHYRSYTSGIAESEGFWFTYEPDKMDDPEKTLFKLGFGDD